MPEQSQDSKKEYARMVCLFLAEQLRGRKTDLNRCADIAEKVLQNINLVDSEQDFLRLIMELQKDFEELHYLMERISRHIETNQRRHLENWVRQYATSIIATDLKMAHEILAYAARENAKFSEVCDKFPEFQQFIETHPHYEARDTV